MIKSYDYFKIKFKCNNHRYKSLWFIYFKINCIKSPFMKVFLKIIKKGLALFMKEFFFNIPMLK